MRFYSWAICLFSVLLLSCNTGAQTHYLSPKDFNEQLQKDKSAVLLDVRTPEEYNSGFIASAVNIDFYREDFAASITKLDPLNPIYIYCRSGSRSDKAMTLLLKAGFKKLYMLEGGINQWQAEKLPIVETPNENSEIKSDDALIRNTIATQSLVLIDFYAEWCIPCKKMEPDLNELNTELKGVVEIIRVDVDVYEQLAAEYKVNAMPTLVYLVSGEEKERTVGYQSKSDILKVLEKYR
ncbi:MAG TPA: thioredoxin domain-containing protein [Bacteroidia bacterium]|nr:thioredoxin domain-containing protein [Bacteroidia bacterium]